jgi:cytochrome c peroxidase
MAAAALSACSTSEPAPRDLGERLFADTALGTNGRACATCHVPEDGFTLTPAHVEELWASDPSDPLFARIDADDPEAETLTFDHLRKGLVRVWLTVPDNVDIIDDAGEVVTPEDRRIFVWRSVPSILDVALTAPYQLDGRAVTLEEQAQGAITAHGEGGKISKQDLRALAAFEREQFSSERARKVAEALEDGVELEDIQDVEATLELTEEEERGRDMYEKVCASCHGGATTTVITNRDIHDLAFPALKPDGNVQYVVPATEPPTMVLADQSSNEFVNVATAVELYLALLGATEHESFTKDLSFPNYRYRFYTDDSRTEIVADLPPVAPPFDPTTGGVAEPDSDGNPIWGPNFFPQFFSTDPGRAMITGSPYGFEAFDVRSLRGISKTAPYFHNNTVETLEEVVSLYSDHLLNRFPSLTQPGEKEQDEDGDIGAEETFTKQQKSDLVAFLKKL